MNHPAWLLAHLHTYHPVIADLLRAKEPADPATAKYGKGSVVSDDPADYPAWDELLASYRQGHADVLAALDDADEQKLQGPMPIKRWAERGFPQFGSILGYLMVRHEALHLGQLSTWRRAAGKGAAREG
jgi:hypothetical protein